MSTVLVKFCNDYNISFNYCNNNIPYCKRDKVSTDFVAKFKNNAYTCHSNILIQHIIIIIIARRVQQFVIMALTIQTSRHVWIIPLFCISNAVQKSIQFISLYFELKFTEVNPFLSTIRRELSDTNKFTTVCWVTIFCTVLSLMHQVIHT